MSDPASEPLRDVLHASATTPTDAERSRSCLWLNWLAAMCGVAGQLLFSNDWCLYTVPAGFLALFVFWAFIATIKLLTRSGRRPQWRYGLILAVAIGLCCGAAFRVIPSWAFNEAFGVSRPDGIRDLRIWRHYEGGPGEHSLILEFKADEEAVRALLASLPEKPDKPPRVPNMEELERDWRETRSWMAVYGLFGGASHSNGRRTWERITPLREPRLFYRGMSPTTSAASTLMLWEPASGRVVVLHSRG